MKSIVVCYHKNCPDGFGAACAAWKKFGNTAYYIAVDPEVLPSEKIKGKEIYILDNSYKKEVQLQLRKVNKKVVILDHHISSEANVRAFPENVFDNDHSGAVLAWQYFHPVRNSISIDRSDTQSTGVVSHGANLFKPIPKLLLYIEDGDLWKFKLPFSQSILSYVYAHDFNFHVWNTLQKELESKKRMARIHEKGDAIIQYRDVLVKEAVAKAYLARFVDKNVFVVNSSTKRITSLVGHALCKKNPPFSVVWYEAKDGTVHVSLRSEGNFDVSKIVQKYGGGGHKNAGGFVLPAHKPFPWKRIEK